MPHTLLYPKPSGTFKGTDLGDEYLFYDRDGEKVHVLNATAREIYLLCDGSRSANDVAGVFAERYADDREAALRDAHALIQQLGELRLLVCGEESEGRRGSSAM